MHAYFSDYIERLAALQTEFNQLLDGLPQAAIDWAPGPNTNSEINSIGVLIAHTAGSTSYWIGDVVGRGATQRVRAHEFATQGLTATTLRDLLTQTVDDARTTVAGLNEQDLATLRTPPGRDEPVTVGWSLLHALEHMATHLGHAQLTRQWWEQSQH